MKPETQSLIRKAYESLQAAELLQREGYLNFAASRAYYAMFYAALALLATIGEETSKHGGVMALFDKHFIRTGILPKEMGKFLHTAFDARQTGDYEDKSEISREMSEQILEFAVKFIKSIEEKLQSQK